MSRFALRLPGKRIGLLVAVVVLTGFAAANIHLVYVATSSQPDCAAHFKTPQENGAGFRAAKSAC
ncbi:hypothetical protein [Pelagibius sp. Alg239-R121]|uniref:hypothetical protein n=1 Tax=Pelagibius sp. Alg239-R121 TaxID=2993448 RepID=UPI0024A6D102|nr:hypothetical protein [Pelagibius sp. Alg239-R121]